VVNLNPYQRHSGWIELSPETFGVPAGQAFQVHELLTGARYFWQGPRNYVDVDPAIAPAHIFRVRRRVRTERDFDYFL
jgi:starch synthase (maltosyl-transferring)